MSKKKPTPGEQADSASVKMPETREEWQEYARESIIKTHMKNGYSREESEHIYNEKTKAFDKIFGDPELLEKYANLMEVVNQYPPGVGMKAVMDYIRSVDPHRGLKISTDVEEQPPAPPTAPKPGLKIWREAEDDRRSADEDDKPKGRRR